MKRNNNILQLYNTGSAATRSSQSVATYNGASRNVPIVQRWDTVNSGITTSARGGTLEKNLDNSSPYLSTGLFSALPNRGRAGARLNQKGGSMNK